MSTHAAATSRVTTRAIVSMPLAKPGDSVVIQGTRSRQGTFVDGVVKRAWFTLANDDTLEQGYWQYSVWVEHETPRRAGRGRMSTGYYCHVGDREIEHNHTRPIDWDAVRGGRVTE